jgi:hypothetical protein
MSHNTYLNGHSKGWPHDHSVDDAYEAPPYTHITTSNESPEYKARSDGSLVLVTACVTHIANFGTFADAQLAAEALNNHKGY